MSRSATFAVATLAVVIVGATTAGAVAQGSGNCPPMNLGGTTNADVPRDEQHASFVNHECAPLQPMVSNGNIVFAVNQPGAHLSLGLISSMVNNGPGNYRPDLQLKAGPGLVSVAIRPFTTEIWCVDRVTGSISIFDLVKQSLVRSIRVGAEPHGLAFNASGDRAWVTCSGVDQVDVIDIRSTSPTRYSVVKSIPIPSRQPRGIARWGNKLFVAPLLSGNNTAPKSNGLEVADAQIKKVIASEGATSQLPDEDVFVIDIHPNDPTQDALSSTQVFKGVGTTLFNLHRRPGSGQLWIPNTDALNADFKGAKNFPNGQVVRNRVTVLNTNNGAMQFIDLDTQAPPGISFGQPTAVAFDTARDRVYVACYGGDSVAVLNGAGVVQGAIRVTARGPWRAGPRGLLIQGDHLYIYNKNDNSIARMSIATPPAGVVHAPMPHTVGYDPTPVRIKKGRGHLINTENSGSGTTSCASCHIDGHLDGLVWDLGDFLDPEGTVDPQFASNDKGPLATQSLRGLRESAPYHWRGEQRQLDFFNGAFVALMERPGGELPPAQFAELQEYMESLVYPANPRQDFFRDYTAEQLEGADVYLNEPNASCNACHTLPLGTNNEVMVDVFAGPARSFKVTQLRGIADKVLQPTFNAGGDFGRAGVVNRLGMGLLHNGTLPSQFDFLDHIFVGLDNCQKQALVDFMTALDTGLAPSTAFQATVNQENAATFTAHLDLMAAADKGDCDLYIIGTMSFDNGANIFHYDGLYVAGTGTALLQHDNWGTFDVNSIIGLAAGGLGEWTFVGAPRGTGWRYGIDLDYDYLRDLDEVVAGTDPEVRDTDHDGFPDGYEKFWGMNPLLAGDPSPDTTPPGFISSKEINVTTNMAKITVVVNEFSTVVASWAAQDGSASDSTPVRPTPDIGWEFTHTVILQDLPAGKNVDVTIVATDPSGNVSAPFVTTVTTPALVFENASHIDDMTLQVQQSPLGDDVIATAKVVDRNGSPVANQTVHGSFYLEIDGIFTMVSPDEGAVTDASGVATWNVPLPPQGPIITPSTTRVAHLSVFFIDGSMSAPSPPVMQYVEAEDVLNYIATGF